MKKILLLLSARIISVKRPLMAVSLLFVFLFIGISSYAQKDLNKLEVSVGQLIKKTIALSDVKIPANYHPKITRKGDHIVGVNEDNEEDSRILYNKKTKPDAAVQQFASSNRSNPDPTPNLFNGGVITQNFDGMGYTNVSPADPTMCAGPNHIIQMINGSSGSYLKVWDRSGVQVVAQTYLDLLVGGAGFTGSGDPVALYDQFSDRYILTEFGNVGGGNINTLIAVVSQTNNPAGAWFVYKFTIAGFFPDYPHWGIMPNGMFASTNDFNTAGTAYLGSSVWSMNKTKMIAGDATAEMQRLRLSFLCAPVNVSGPTAPTAVNTGMFMYYNDDDYTASATDVDSLGMLTFTPDFAVPANTVITYVPSMVAAPFKTGVCGGRNCVPSASGNGYDALSDRIMNRVWYRKFAGYESIVLNYTVDANAGIGSPKSGIRWYELRRNGGNWSIFQQSTYSPDADWRWMGSININSKGQIALGFNLSSPTKYASIYFTGRNIGNTANTMSIAEVSAKNGTAYGTFGNRWGDYNDISTDIVDDSLFWMTAMYGNTASAWATRITQFKLGDCDNLASSQNLTQAAVAVPELQNIVYTNSVSSTGCVPIVNFLMTDTLPLNVTFVSATNGGTYNAGNRVVSWPVNVGVGATQTYQLTVNINAGSYFAPVTLLNETVTAVGIPTGWAATIGTGTSTWVGSAAQSHSAPNSLFGVDNAAANTDFRVSTTAPLALGGGTSKLSFWHNYNTESGWDGGVVEISTNGGGTWTDMGANMLTNGYNNTVGGTNPLGTRAAFSGNSGGWIQTTATLLPYTNQNALFRFRMSSDDNTAATGWYVDDINITRTAQVDMRTSLFNSTGARISFKDTVTLILAPAGCTPPVITGQPANSSVCVGTSTSFTVTATATTPTYQWQLSTAGAGGPWNNVPVGAPYSGINTATLTINPTAIGMNSYQYRCIVGGCAPDATSNPAILTVLAGPLVTAQPVNASACANSTASFSVTASGTSPTYQWQLSTAGAGGPWNNIPVGAPYSGTTTNTLTINPTVVGMNGYQYRCVVTACAASVNSNPGILTIVALSVGGTVNPPVTNITCATNTGTLTLSGHTGSVIRWEFSTVSNVGPWTTVANTTTTLTYNNLAVTTYYQAVVQAPGCTAATSSVATVNVSGTTLMSIIADPGTTLCQGDPTLLTAVNAPTLTTFTSPAAVINIPGAGTGAAAGSAASIYPSVLNVAGIPAGATVKSVTLTGLNHTWSTDVDILLQSPTAQNVILISDVGTGSGDFSNNTYTLDDAAAATIPNVNIPPNGTYKPTNVVGTIGNEPDEWPTIGAVAQPTPLLSSFTGNFNGNWNLFISDDGGGDAGTMTGGWSITFSVPGGPIVGGTFAWSPALGLNQTNINPVAASPAATTTYTVSHNNGAGCIRTANITITVNTRPSVTAQPAGTTVCNGAAATFTVGGAGTGVTYQWQQSTTGTGGVYVDLINGAPYSGVTTATLTVNPATLAMTGYAYRCRIGGTCPPTVNSNGAVLTVNALPVVTIAPASPVCGGFAGVSGTALTASGATSYIWSPTAGLFTNANGTGAYTGTNLATVYAAPTANTVYTVTGTAVATGCTNTASITVNYQPAPPTVSPANATICLGTIQPLTITSSLAPTTVTASVSGLNAAVPDGTGAPLINSLNIAGVPAIATISEVKVTFTMAHTWVGDVDVNIVAPNLGRLNLVGGLDNGGGGNTSDNFTNTAFSSNGGLTISGAAAPRTGTYTAEARAGYGPTGYEQTVTTWGALIPTATSANGTWTLAMGDFATGDFGFLNAWSVDVTYGLPSTGIWSRNAVGSGDYTGLFTDALATAAYAGTSVQTVYAKPAAAGLYNYYVTVSTGTCSSAGRLVPVTVNQPAFITTQPLAQTICTDKVATFTVAATGTALTYQWQVSTSGLGGPYANITNGGVYSGATTNTLTITQPPVTMSGYYYQCVVQGAAPCPAATSNFVILTVNPLPTVVISPVATKLFPGLNVTLTSTVSPFAAATYTWFRDGIAVAGATGPTLYRDVDGLGVYTLRVTDVNGCTNTSNVATITDSVSANCFLYPNPTSGKFQVRYHSVAGNVLPRSVTVYDSKGTQLSTENFTVVAPYAQMDIDLSRKGKGVYWVEIGDLNGRRLQMCRVLVQ